MNKAAETFIDAVREIGAEEASRPPSTPAQSFASEAFAEIKQLGGELFDEKVRSKVLRDALQGLADALKETCSNKEHICPICSRCIHLDGHKKRCGVWLATYAALEMS